MASKKISSLPLESTLLGSDRLLVSRVEGVSSSLACTRDALANSLGVSAVSNNLASTSDSLAAVSSTLLGGSESQVLTWSGGSPGWRSAGGGGGGGVSTIGAMVRHTPSIAPNMADSSLVFDTIVYEDVAGIVDSSEPGAISALRTPAGVGRARVASCIILYTPPVPSYSYSEPSIAVMQSIGRDSTFIGQIITGDVVPAVLTSTNNVLLARTSVSAWFPVTSDWLFDVQIAMSAGTIALEDTIVATAYFAIEFM